MPFFAHGKLLLTSEYAVLDGAPALAVPTRQGQSLAVHPVLDTPGLRWESINFEGKTWFSATFDGSDFNLQSTSNAAVSARLQQILVESRRMNPLWAPSKKEGLHVTVTADFPLDWGLGSSSTLLALVARWADIDPYALLAATFGGSGYDIACAFSNGPIIYRRHAATSVERAERIEFKPTFANQLYFVYLGQKQDSRAGIRRYQLLTAVQKQQLVQQTTDLTQRAIHANSLAEWEAIMLEHESGVAQILDLPRAQERFPGFEGAIKSLGAWGGDFVLVTSEKGHAATQYWFHERGYDVCIPYQEMVLS